MFRPQSLGRAKESLAPWRASPERESARGQAKRFEKRVASISARVIKRLHQTPLTIGRRALLLDPGTGQECLGNCGARDRRADDQAPARCAVLRRPHLALEFA